MSHRSPCTAHTPRPWRALVATSRKDGLRELGRDLYHWGWEIFATDGCALHLQEAGVPAQRIATYCGIPDLLGGRIKTLTVQTFGGLLMRRGDPADEHDAARWGFAPFHMLVSGFYGVAQRDAAAPFSTPWAEKIDVGGPAMLRAAAKNHAFVIPLCAVDSYAVVVEQLRSENGDPAALPLDTRRCLASKAFDELSRYDRIIADRLSRG